MKEEGHTTILATTRLLIWIFVGVGNRGVCRILCVMSFCWSFYVLELGNFSVLYIWICSGYVEGGCKM